MATSQTNLGSYTYGEKPPPLLVTFNDAAGDAINLTGYTVEAQWKVKGQSPDDTPNSFSCSLSDATNGVVSVPWGTQSTSPFADSATAPYTVELEVWAGDGTNLYCSEQFRFAVRVAVAGTSTPAI